MHHSSKAGTEMVIRSRSGAIAVCRMRRPGGTGGILTFARCDRECAASMVLSSLARNSVLVALDEEEEPEAIAERPDERSRVEALDQREETTPTAFCDLDCE